MNRYSCRDYISNSNKGGKGKHYHNHDCTSKSTGIVIYAMQITWLTNVLWKGLLSAFNCKQENSVHKNCNDDKPQKTCTPATSKIYKEGKKLVWTTNVS